MKKVHFSGSLVMIAGFLMILAGSAAACAQGTVREEMGLTKMKVSYPETGAAVQEMRPMIAVDFSGLETPVDPATVVVLLNGADVTAASDITPAYMIFQPQDDLAPGYYEVRVTAADINKTTLEPLTWSFEIAGARGATAEGDRTTGRLTVSTDFIHAGYDRQSAIDVSQIFREKEGMKLNTDLYFSNISEGRTLTGTYHRETQAYSDIELDKIRLGYADSNFNATLGHFWMKLSDLTVAGTEIAGLKIDKKISNWTLSGFSGRTQDPSVSGTYKQITNGLRGAYGWDSTNTTTITILDASENRAERAQAAGVTPPAHDRIASVLHEFRVTDDIAIVLEAAKNIRTVDGLPSTRNISSRLAVTGVMGSISGELELYSMDKDFLPVSDGSAKYLKSNREGGRASGRWEAAEWLAAGGEYEQYDSADTANPANPNVTTKRGVAYITLRPGFLPEFTYRKSKMTTTTGIVSDADSVMSALTLPGRGNLAETRFTSGWQDVSYEAPGILSETLSWMFTFSTSYRDRLGLSSSYTTGDTDSSVWSAAGGAWTFSSVENSSFSAGVDWTVAPMKFIWGARYEKIGAFGASLDTEEERLKTSMKYVVNDVYSLNAGVERIEYGNVFNSFYDYRETIVRTGVEWSF